MTESDVQRDVETTLVVNGMTVTRRIPARQHLIDFLREELGLTGSHTACEHGVCGMCTIRVDGKIVRGCLTLAVQAHGKRIDTVEGLSDSGELRTLQHAFHVKNALQCGFCTPGMLMAALDLVTRHPNAGREQIREHLSGNYCRCTGYEAIVDAIESVLAQQNPR
jgi:aerobic-type carbon monoxide dehydrogenase small subunit (CoxS/CutS family)